LALAQTLKTETLTHRWLAGLLALVVSGCVAEPCDPSVPADPALSAFYDRLYALESGAGSDTFRILHLGDSHIAGDRFSGSLQRRFSARFGNAGRGQLPPAKPFPYYRRQGISVEASEGWTVFSSLSGVGVGPFGLSGYRAESASSEDWMSFTIEDGVPLQSVLLNVLQQPGGGSLSLEIDGIATGRFQTNGSVPRLMQIAVEASTARRAVVRPTGDGPVSLLAWGGEGAGPGIVYEVQGIPGATLRVMDAWEASIVAAELATMQPDLILLGYGTNEGFDDALDVDLYRLNLERRVQRLKTMLPNATILLLGAFDGARLPAWSELRPSTQQATRAALPCEPLALHERATYSDLSRDHDPVLGRWHAPPRLQEVQEVQKAVARSQRLAYWDGAGAMGGACAIHQFVFSEPPLAYGDHVHLTPAGADLMAGKLWDRLIRPYEALVCRRRLAE
jgi:lysophospholipase L1-like esterase